MRRCQMEDNRMQQDKRKRLLKSTLHSNSGIALFVVLWALVILSVIVGEFCFATRTEVKTTLNFKEETQAYYLARAGINAAIYEILIRDRQLVGTTKQEEDGQTDDKINWNLTGYPTRVSFASGKTIVKIQNETGKVNLNRAEPNLLRILLRPFDIEDKKVDIIVDSIVDWRDTDNFHGINGAEDDYYQKLAEPYLCKDNPFDSIAELLMVRGVTPEIYYGGLKDMVTVWDDNDGEEPIVFSPIQQYLTLENRQFNTMQEFLTIKNRSQLNQKDEIDLNRIDINSAPPLVLLALPGMDEYLVDSIIESRTEAAFTSVEELLNIVGSRLYQAISPFVAVQTSDFYSVAATGMVEGSSIFRTVTATVRLDDETPAGYRIVHWMDSVYEKVVDDSDSGNSDNG